MIADTIPMQEGIRIIQTAAGFLFFMVLGAFVLTAMNIIEDLTEMWKKRGK